MRFLVLFLLLVGCTDKFVDKAIYEEGEVLKTSKEFTIPKSLKERIQKEYISYVRDIDPSNIETDEELIASLPRDYLEVEMFLRQLGPGTLVSDTVYRSPRGGGLVDLSDTVIGDKGSFFIKFNARDYEKPEEELDNLKAYYVSEVKENVIDDKQYGTGCGALIDISKAVINSKTGNGLRVNAKNNRYFHTMAGLYVFVSFAYEQVKLAALRVQNSDITGFECPGRN